MEYTVNGHKKIFKYEVPYKILAKNITLFFDDIILFTVFFVLFFLSADYSCCVVTFIIWHFKKFWLYLGSNIYIVANINKMESWCAFDFDLLCQFQHDLIC